MDALQKKLREEAARLLTEGAANVVIGFEAGSTPLTVAPSFAYKPEDAEKLVLNRLCGQNLAKYVTDLIAENNAANARVKPEDRKKFVVAVVAPGCATRSIVIHLNERQYERGEVFILGVPCTGMVDRAKLVKACGGEEIVHGELAGDTVKATGGGQTREFPATSVLADWCATCRFPNPVLADVKLGPDAPERDTSREYEAVDEMEALSEEGRWAAFMAEMNKCMRCYACRNACPSCYCRSCFVEQSQPQWLGIGQSPQDVETFQIMRLYHMAGRCVDCGTCSAVCPMGVDLRKFLKKIEKDGRTMFGHTVGVSVEEPALLATTRDDDPEDFIFNP